MNDNLIMARRIAGAVDAAGGKTYFVGGYVRDLFLGRENKDIDLEVHGVGAETLAAILDTLGERMTLGASFGVMGLRHYDLDIAMPRSERATGRGHRDFAVCVDPFIGEEKAARRRDFTVNALMQNVLTGEILDFFGGLADLEKRRIRHVCDESFGEDPLRVLRAAQFAARFSFDVAEETIALAADMPLDALPGERVMGELEKALIKAPRPSVFFELLRRMDQLSVWFPELAALIGVPQPPEHHPEGDVWNHTMQVLDEAAKLRPEARQPLYFLLAALCHDFGKAVTTETINGRIHAYGHENAGLPLAQRFLGRLTNETRLRGYVLNMTELHMGPNKLVGQNAGDKAFMRLYDRALCAEDLLLLAKADHFGCRPPETDSAALAADYAPTEARLREMLALYRARMAAPCVTGRDLAEAGFAPGPLYGEALAYVRRLRLAGVPKEEQLRQTLGRFRAKS